MLEPCSGEPVIQLLHRLVSSSINLESESITKLRSQAITSEVEVGTVTSELPL